MIARKLRPAVIGALGAVALFGAFGCGKKADTAPPELKPDTRGRMPSASPRGVPGSTGGASGAPQSAPQPE